ncbi:MAG: hypothetical protein ACOX7G_04805 [Candidatus Scatomorpha sp.]|jgi:hypothetical protein
MTDRRPVFLSLVLVLMLVFAVLTTGVMASSAPAADAEYETASGWETGSIAEAFSEVKDGGSIKLLGNVKLNSGLTLDSGKTIRLLGEGHSLAVSNSLSLSNGTVLELGANDYGETLVICANPDTIADHTQALIALSDSCVLNMYDNVTLGPSSSGGQCAGVQLKGRSEFNMYGGLTTECVNWISVSGAVLVTEHSAFNMYNGVIDKCSGWNGGAIGIDPSGVIGPEPEHRASLNISGGTISNCSDNWYGGGAICYSSADPAFINISGLTISGCSAGSDENGYGGAIFIYTTSTEASIEISDTEITNCTANYGGGICLYQGDLTIADDVKIHNNSASVAGDDLYFSGSVPIFYDPPQRSDTHQHEPGDRKLAYRRFECRQRH